MIEQKLGSLSVVGCGILTPAHLTQESIARIESSDVVHVLVPDPLGLSTLTKLNSNIKNLGDLYFDATNQKTGANRQEAYDNMVEAILNDVRCGLKVCAVFYGHPGVFVYPSHHSILKAKQEGFKVKMLPAISAEDCLFADLGIDPGDTGCQSYEASQFIFFRHSSNVAAPLILWQIGVVGDISLRQLKPAVHGLDMLQDKLLESYPSEHPVILYEASTLPIMPPRRETILLKELNKAEVSSITTLVVPAILKLEVNFEFCQKWGIDTSLLT